jgi:ankyrin repeat protein
VGLASAASAACAHPPLPPPLLSSPNLVPPAPVVNMKAHLMRCSQKGIDIKECYCLLFEAIANGGKERVVMLAQGGFNLFVVNEEGDPALCFAALHGKLPIAQYLLKQKVPVDGVDAYGHTAFWVAAARQDIAMMDSLLCKEANINHANNSGITALFEAVQKGRLTMVEFLIRRKAAVDKADNAGFTPLGMAVQKGLSNENMLSIIRVLAKAGAKPLEANEAGITPFGMAKRSKKIVAILEPYLPKKPSAIPPPLPWKREGEALSAPPLPPSLLSPLAASPGVASPSLFFADRGGEINRIDLDTVENKKGDMIYLATQVTQYGRLVNILTMIDLRMKWAKTRVLLDTIENMNWSQKPLFSSNIYPTEQAARQGHVEICKQVQEGQSPFEKFLC